MKSFLIGLILFTMAGTLHANTTSDSAVNVIELSQQLLLQAKTHEPTDSLVAAVQQLTELELSRQLTNDNLKKAFWINLYNAFTQIILSKNPDRYQDRSSFFGDKQIAIAGKNLSLDDIEHGILRHSKIKWSHGYLNKWFPSAFEKQQRVDTLDYRIHFSLNCGARSCPPIAFYNPGNLDRQLDLATKVYLTNESNYDKEKNSIALPAIMGWFRGDFGGKKNMISILQKLQIVPANNKPSISFKQYDWNLFLENYKTT